MDAWFSSDYHFFHANIIKYCKRPFVSVEEMNEKLIENHNSIVSKGDAVFILGDFAFCTANKANNLLERMNGEKILIVGNHDEELRDKFTGFREIWDSKQIILGNQKFYLNHYAARVWPASHHGSINLYGHSHGNLPPQGKQMDVGVDTNNYFPYSIDQIMEHFKDYKNERSS